MSEAKHTPGVWYAEPPDDESDDFRSKYFWKVRVGTESNGGWQLAHISSLNTGHEESDARLMAAAPELLEALVALRSIEFGHSEEDICAVRRKCDAVIAKATEAQ